MKVIVHIQHTLTSNDNEIKYCQKNKIFPITIKLKWECPDRVPKIWYFKAASLFNPFFTYVAIWLLILCHKMCLQNSCWLFYTFSHILHLVPVLCLINLKCAKKIIIKCLKHVYNSFKSLSNCGESQLNWSTVSGPTLPCNFSKLK